MATYIVWEHGPGEGVTLSRGAGVPVAADGLTLLHGTNRAVVPIEAPDWDDAVRQFDAWRDAGSPGVSA